MRLLIADDEDYAREGLIESIPWEKYGIDEIMQAKDGREAELSVTDIAADMHFSAAHLNVLFRKETGVTVKQYISDYRLNLSKKLLCNPHIKVSEIAERCGYSNANYFSKVFRASENMTPVEYRKENCK